MLEYWNYTHTILTPPVNKTISNTNVRENKTFELESSELVVGYNNSNALIHHYHQFHRSWFRSKPALCAAFKITFLHEPSLTALNLYQDLWLDRIQPNIA